MITRVVISAIVILLLGACPVLSHAQQVISNPGFEDGLTGWGQLWTREANAGTRSVSKAENHSGSSSAEIEHTGTSDWSMDWEQKVDVTPGDLFELGGWARTKAGTPKRSSVILCVSTWTAQGKTQEWLYGASHLRGEFDWKAFHSRFIIPEGIVRIQLRIVGEGPSHTWLDDISLVKKGNVADMRRKGIPEKMTLENTSLSVVINTHDAALQVTDKRTGQLWKQQAVP
ncbi:MAG TPA: carbohydrate binding domain-containing protein, partial [Candidatus Methylacidiphilales bacterium]|nr:carbohydrate binding domain-containing protein [Candidatus Methylacidiphilales bacterium]